LFDKALTLCGHVEKLNPGPFDNLYCFAAKKKKERKKEIMKKRKAGSIKNTKFMAFQKEMIHSVWICVIQGDKAGNKMPGRSITNTALRGEPGILPSDYFKRFLSPQQNLWH